jgi:putative copper export protein
MDDVTRFFHLLGAAVWIGGMVTMAALVPVMRRSGATIEQIRAAARGFGMVAWVAMGAAVATGMFHLVRYSIPTRGNTALLVKLLLVGTAVALAWAHQVFGRDLPPAFRGAIQGILLLLGLGILWSAVQL